MCVMLISDAQTMDVAAMMRVRRDDRIDFNVDDLMTTETYCWKRAKNYAATD